MKTKKTEKFIINAKKIHGDKYDYSLTDYKNYKQEVKIICPTHGIFEQKINTHLRGCGCQKCNSYIRKTTEEFINDAKKIHGDKYDYNLVDYKNNDAKIKIICQKHGIFEQKSGSHLKYGCKKCSAENFTKSTDKFIIESKKIHCNKYDYSLTTYINALTKVKIICNIHGEFEQTPNSHLRGIGCDKCLWRQLSFKGRET